MPIVRIDLIEGKSEEYRAQVGEIVYQTLGQGALAMLSNHMKAIIESNQLSQ